MHLASMLGHSFSVLTVLPRLRAQFETLAAVYGLKGKLASVRAVDIPVLELEDDIGATQAKLVSVAEAAIHEGRGARDRFRLHRPDGLRLAAVPHGPPRNAGSTFP